MMRFDAVFLERVKDAARLDGKTFSEFVRLAASRLAADVFDEHMQPVPDLNGWKLESGGDYSEARAKKDKNYRKRTVSDKVSEALRMVKEKGEGNGRRTGRGRRKDDDPRARSAA